MKKNIFCFTITVILFANTILAQDNWNNQNPTSKPQPLIGHAMAFIGDDKVMVFGGLGVSSISDETWVYDLNDNSWSQKTQSIKPAARFAHATAYLGDDLVLLFGGADESFAPVFNDTWVYDLSDNTWTQKFPTTTSPSA